MSLPALASLEALAARMPSGIAEGDEARARAALDDASAIIRAEAGEDWVTDDEPPALDEDNLPDVVVSVCLAAARRAFVNPDGVTAESLDGYSTQYRNDSADVYLTRHERRLVKGAAGLGSLGVHRTTRSDYGALDTPGVSVPVGTVVSDEFPYDY